jgi:acetolactate synthase-1/2/3 large subunit
MTAASTVEVPAIHAMLEVLENEGVEYIFGVPGGPLTGLFEAMRQRQTIRLVLAKHEAGAAFMAASNARVRGGLAVCCGTSGPGATNALTGIASAYADCLPVLLLTGQVATSAFGKGAIQESTAFGTDIVDLFRSVTKLSAMLPSAERSPDILRMAIRTAMTGRPGPVHLNMPADMVTRVVPYKQIKPARYRPGVCPVDRAAIAQAAELVAAAERPCVLAGSGVALARGSDALVEFARANGIPVATSPKGKGTFPEDDPLSLGVLGFGGHDLAEKYLATVDVLVVIGSSLNEFVTNGGTISIRPTTALVQIDVDPGMMARNYPIDLAVIGDAQGALRELTARLSALAESSGLRATRDNKRLHSMRSGIARYMADEMLEADTVPIKPQRLIREMRAAMPNDALLFVDNGNSIIWGTHYFEARRPNTYFIDLGFAAMGSAVAGVVGGAMAARGHRAVALVGDAAFAMHGFEVHTAVDERLPIVWVVLNNGGHGMVHQGDQLMKGVDLGVSLFRVPLDIAGLGRAMGAHGVRVDSAQGFRREFEAALHADGPTVIDVGIDAEEVAPTLRRRVHTLAQFFAGRRSEQP